jgi:protein-disulfide isomerase
MAKRHETPLDQVSRSADRRTRDIAFWLSLVLVVAALVASAILLVDYVRPSPVYCEVGGGCEKMKATVFAHPFGIPLPAIGLLGVLAIGFSALLPGKNARTAQLGFAAVGGAVGAFLLIIQARIGSICPFCAVVDTSSVLLAVVSVLRFRWKADPPSNKMVLIAGVISFVGSIATPLIIGFRIRAIPTNVPQTIADEMRKTERGKVTVVDFVDFECPFCRMTNESLEPLLESRKDKIRLTRKMVPLKSHRHAMDAAKAGCCGEKMGKGDAMASALFTTPPDDLTPENCEKLAQKLGLDVDAYKACVADPKTAQSIADDTAEFRASGGKGLPLIFIDDKVIRGMQPKEDLEATLDGAIKRL